MSKGPQKGRIDLELGGKDLLISFSGLVALILGTEGQAGHRWNPKDVTVLKLVLLFL